MPPAANLDAQLDKVYEDKALTRSSRRPVSVLAGVTEADGDHLRDAYGVRTVGDSGKNKYFRAAYSMTLLADGKWQVVPSASIVQVPG